MKTMLPILPAAIAVLLFASAGEARAEWRILFGIDVGAATDSVLLIGELDQRATLYAKCLPKTETPAELTVHVFDGLSDQLTGAAQGEIVVSTDTGGLWSSPGERRRESGFIVTRWIDSTTMRGVIEDIGAAKATIRVDVSYPASQASWTATAAGSTAAAQAFIEACEERMLPATEGVSRVPIAEPAQP